MFTTHSSGMSPPTARVSWFIVNADACVHFESVRQIVGVASILSIAPKAPVKARTLAAATRHARTHALTQGLLAYANRMNVGCFEEADRHPASAK